MNYIWRSKAQRLVSAYLKNFWACNGHMARTIAKTSLWLENLNLFFIKSPATGVLTKPCFFWCWQGSTHLSTWDNAWQMDIKTYECGWFMYEDCKFWPLVGHHILRVNWFSWIQRNILQAKNLDTSKIKTCNAQIRAYCIDEPNN